MNESVVQNSSEMNLLNSLRFWPLLVTNIVSIICSFFLLFVLFSDRSLRQSLNNHIVIILLLVNLVCQFVDNPAYLNYLRIKVVWPSTPATCIVWIIAAYHFYSACTLLMALASIQRHILIFHQSCISTFKRRILIHYLPLTIMFLYSIVFGGTIIILLIRDYVSYDYSKRMCGILTVWIANYPGLQLWEVIFNEVLPVPIITISSIGLLVRVLVQKRQMNRRIEWRKQRKMTVQLLSISALFCMVNLPPVLLNVIGMIVDLDSLAGIDTIDIVFGYLTYYQSVLLPFVCLSTLWNGVKKKCTKIGRSLVRLKRMTRTTVAPFVNN